MHRLSTVVALSLSLSASGDTLSDVRAAVGRLQARQPVRATYAAETSVRASGRFANETQAQKVAAEVTHDASGVTILLPQALVEKATKLDSNAQETIASLRTMTVVEALDYRDSLLEMLKGAVIVEERRMLFRSRPARRLVLKLNAPVRRRGSIIIGSVKVKEDRLTFWVGDDNLPLAAERVRSTRSGFLMFHADSTNHTGFTFSSAGDRLILARLETRSSGSAIGQKIDEASVQTVTVH